MDALMAALLLGAICQAGDKTPWLAAILADRFRSPIMVAIAAALGLAANYALGAVGGLLVGPMITPEAKLLLLALALLFAAVSTSFRRKSPDRLEGWKLGAFGTSVIGLAIMILGDRMQFIVFALATRSEVPWLAAVGATIGAAAVSGTAAALGEERWLALPQRMIGIGTAVLLMILAIVLALSGLRLI